MPTTKLRTIDEIKQLLKDETGDEWEPLEGFYALTSVVKGESNKITFNPGSGVPLKVFVNHRTGETKTFVAQLVKESGFSIK